MPYRAHGTSRISFSPFIRARAGASLRWLLAATVRSYTRSVEPSDNRPEIDPEAPVRPEYLSGHLRSLRTGLGYTRSSYAQKAWQTFGSAAPADLTSAVLEIGPGECEFAELLFSDVGFEDVAVVDMSPEVIDVAQALGLSATLVTDTRAHLHDRVGTYDVVIMLHVLEHVQKHDVIPLLEAIRHSLRDGGRLLLEVPNMGDPLNGLYFRYSDFTHEVGFTEESLTYVLIQAGFRHIEYLPQAGATGKVTRRLQLLGRKCLHGLLFVLNLPNGRQMRRQIGPVLSVRADV